MTENLEKTDELTPQDNSKGNLTEPEDSTLDLNNITDIIEIDNEKLAWDVNKDEIYEFLAYLNTELKYSNTNEIDEAISPQFTHFKNMIFNLKKKEEELDVIKANNQVKDQKIIEITEENKTLRSIVENNEKDRVVNDKTIQNLEKKLKICDDDKTSLYSQLKGLNSKYLECKESENIMKRFCDKIYTIHAIPSDLSLFESLDIFSGKEQERTRVFKSYKNLMLEKQELIKQNMLLNEHSSTINTKIQQLKNTIEDKQLIILNKEQENISLQRQLNTMKYAKNAIYEFIHRFNQIASQSVQIEASYKRIYWLYKKSINELADLHTIYNDLRAQHDLLASLNTDLGKRIINTEMELHFITDYIQDKYEQTHLEVSQLKINFNKCRYKFINERNPRNSTRSISYSNKRYECVISDLKKELNEMKHKKDNIDELNTLKCQNYSLLDDIAILRSELSEKNKLVDILLKKDIFLDENVQKNGSFIEKLISSKFSDGNLQITNDYLKNSLEETLHRNILLKENIYLLGLEIERLTKKTS